MLRVEVIDNLNHLIYLNEWLTVIREYYLLSSTQYKIMLTHIYYYSSFITVGSKVLITISVFVLVGESWW